MHHVDLIVGKHGVEEIRKGGNQTRPQGIGKIRDLGGCPVDGEVGCGPGRRPPAFIEDGGQSQADRPRQGPPTAAGKAETRVSSLSPSSSEP